MNKGSISAILGTALLSFIKKQQGSKGFAVSTLTDEFNVPETIRLEYSFVYYAPYNWTCWSTVTTFPLQLQLQAALGLLKDANWKHNHPEQVLDEDEFPGDEEEVEEEIDRSIREEIKEYLLEDENWASQRKITAVNKAIDLVISNAGMLMPTSIELKNPEKLLTSQVNIDVGGDEPEEEEDYDAALEDLEEETSAEGTLIVTYKLSDLLKDSEYDLQKVYLELKTMKEDLEFYASFFKDLLTIAKELNVVEGAGSETQGGIGSVGSLGFYPTASAIKMDLGSLFQPKDITDTLPLMKLRDR